jgi:hypothetical protein
VLVGHKADLPARQRAVPSSAGETLARQLRVPHFETSAGDAEAVATAFSALLDAVAARVPAAGAPDYEATGIVPADRSLGEGVFGAGELTAEVDWLD